MGGQRAATAQSWIRPVVTERERVQLERGFVLHQRPYLNTSQLLECLTEHHGVIGLVAQGSRRRSSGRRAALQPFAPLHLSWIRRGDLGRLTGVEAAGPSQELSGDGLFAGFYANELLLRLMARGDPNDAVYSCYSRCLAELARAAATARTVRLFELRLLEALGYGLGLDCDAESRQPIRAGARYRFQPEHGFSLCSGPADAAETYGGVELISLREQRLDDPGSLRAAKRLLMQSLNVYLGERPLRTRAILEDVVARELRL